MLTIAALSQFLESFAPPHLAESWDNVGLLVGDRDAQVRRVMTCLTITPESAAEAVQEQADLIVSHHPLPFKPLPRLSTDQTPGRLLWQLMGARIAIYSPHTAFDSAAGGINQRLAAGLGLHDIQPLVPAPADPLGLGTGRWGRLSTPLPLAELAEALKRFLRIPGLHRVGPVEQRVERVAVACGSAGSLLPAARRAQCDALVLGEANFHTCLEAQALAAELAARFPELTVWPSRAECDPLVWC